MPRPAIPCSPRVRWKPLAAAQRALNDPAAVYRECVDAVGRAVGYEQRPPVRAERHLRRIALLPEHADCVLQREQPVRLETPGYVSGTDRCDVEIGGGASGITTGGD